MDQIFRFDELDLAKRTLSLRASKRERSKQSRSFVRSKTRKRSCRRSGSFPRPTLLQDNSRDHEKKRPFSGPISFRAARPPTLQKKRAIQKKGARFRRKRKVNRVGLATSRRLYIIVAKGLFAFTTEVPKAAFGFISFIRGAVHYKLSALSEIERQ